MQNSTNSTNSFFWANDVLVNLKNVSNINVLDTRRVVFNMNYTIEMKTRNDKKLISDYVYWDAKDTDDLDKNLSNLYSNEYIKQYFLSIEGQSILINKNEISSVKFMGRQNRIIFNLSHPVTFKNHDGKSLTSEFVYINCKLNEEFQKNSQSIKSQLNLN